MSLLHRRAFSVEDKIPAAAAAGREGAVEGVVDGAGACGSCSLGASVHSLRPRLDCRCPRSWLRLRGLEAAKDLQPNPKSSESSDMSTFSLFCAALKPTCRIELKLAWSEHISLDSLGRSLSCPCFRSLYSDVSSSTPLTLAVFDRVVNSFAREASLELHPGQSHHNGVHILND